MENYSNATVSPKEEKMPYHIEKAQNAFNELTNGLNHKEQVEAFKYLQKKLCDFRNEMCKAIENELNMAQSDLKTHIDGTNTIASGL